jgi:hypothetical protein
VKEELFERKVQKTPEKNPPERVFSRYTTPYITYIATVCGNQQLHKQLQIQPQHAQPVTTERVRVQPAVH